MGKSKVTYQVTHSYAPDPDSAKVQATLQLWAEAIAEKVISEGRPELPPTRITVNLPAVAKRMRKAKRHKAT